LAETDWAVIRKVEENVDIPLYITNARRALRAQAAGIKEDINRLTTVLDVLEFTYNLG